MGALFIINSWGKDCVKKAMAGCPMSILWKDWLGTFGQFWKRNGLIQANSGYRLKLLWTEEKAGGFGRCARSSRFIAGSGNCSIVSAGRIMSGSWASWISPQKRFWNGFPGMKLRAWSASPAQAAPAHAFWIMRSSQAHMLNRLIKELATYLKILPLQSLTQSILFTTNISHTEFKCLIQESYAEDIEGWKETFEIMADKNLMRQIRSAEKAVLRPAADPGFVFGLNRWMGKLKNCF